MNGQIHFLLQILLLSKRLGENAVSFFSSPKPVEWRVGSRGGGHRNPQHAPHKAEDLPPSTSFPTPHSCSPSVLLCPTSQPPLSTGPWHPHVTISPRVPAPRVAPGTSLPNAGCIPGSLQRRAASEEGEISLFISGLFSAFVQVAACSSQR